MALIKLSSIGITNLSGKAGGSVYAHNRGGAYMRNFAVPANPQSSFQSVVRADFGALASAWRQLSESEREAWREAAPIFPYIDRFGDERVMSGANLYISLNRNLQIINQVGLTEPPTPQGVDGVGSLVVTGEINAGAFSLEISGTRTFNATAATTLAIYATTSVSAGVSYVKNRYKLLDVTSSVAGIEAGIDITDAYRARFGVPGEGAKIFVKVFPINTNTGERGADVTAPGIVTDITP